MSIKTKYITFKWICKNWWSILKGNHPKVTMFNEKNEDSDKWSYIYEVKAYYTTFKYLCKSWLFHFNCKKKRKPKNSAKKSPYEVQRKIEGLINKKKIDMENKKYKDAFEGFYMEMMGTLDATSRAREVNPNDEFIKTVNDVYIGIVRRINWWKEKFDIPVDKDSPTL